MNEPEFSASYASGQWNGNQAADFIKILSKTIAANNLSSQVGIACCEAEGWGGQTNLLNGIKSGGADTLLKAITTHTYNSGASGRMNTNLPVWLSEQCDLNGQWTTAWYSGGGAGEGLTWANNVMNGVLNNGISGYLYWEGVQWPSPTTNEKIIMVDANSGRIDVSRRLWALANWSRFVRPGAVRVGSTGGSGVRSAAFKNVDGSIAVVFTSSSGSASSVSIKITGTGGFTPTTATAWVSDGSHNCESTTATVGSDGSVAGSIAARSITTFHIPAPAAAEPPATPATPATPAAPAAP
jgi:O-glycosyl hydrolase